MGVRRSGSELDKKSMAFDMKDRIGQLKHTVSSPLAVAKVGV